MANTPPKGNKVPRSNPNDKEFPANIYNVDEPIAPEAASAPRPKPKPKLTPKAPMPQKLKGGGMTRADGCAKRGKTKGRMV